jgi:hypothetical protein
MEARVKWNGIFPELMENDCEEVRMWNKKLRNAAYGPGYEACG